MPERNAAQCSQEGRSLVFRQAEEQTAIFGNGKHHPIQYPLLLRKTTRAVKLVRKRDENFSAAQHVVVPSDPVGLAAFDQEANLHGPEVHMFTKSRLG